MSGQLRIVRVAPKDIVSVSERLLLAVRMCVYRDVSTRGAMSEALKEMIFVAISAAAECAYCEAAHLAFCRILTVDPETSTNLVHNIDALKPPRTRDIVRLAVKAGTEPKSLVKADYDLLRGNGLSDEEIIEIVAMSAFARYAITGRGCVEAGCGSVGLIRNQKRPAG
jgi:uncharacterized peroxidase-related enzyme